jgi:hypothetical protein
MYLPVGPISGAYKLPIFVATYAITPTLWNKNTMEKIFSSNVTGCKSPNLTVLKEVTAQYIEVEYLCINPNSRKFSPARENHVPSGFACNVAIK